MLIARNIEAKTSQAMKNSPVVLINGARQTGKSTLVNDLLNPNKRRPYISFDNLETLQAAKSNPQTFVLDLPERVILDEIQRIPELLRSIKYSVDLNRKPGRFVITGSAHVLVLPKASESLAGRMLIETLWPLSQGEIRGVKESFIDTIFSNAKLPFQAKPVRAKELAAMATTGGYPAVVRMKTEADRQAWFNSYMTSLMERDVRDLSNIEQVTLLPNLLGLLAARCGGLLNNSDISRLMQMPLTTLKRYLALLQALFIYVPMPPWFTNRGQRFVKSPKVYLNDTGLLCHLLKCDADAIAGNTTLLGHIIENFVVMELIKQASWSKAAVTPYHFRTQAGQEVDIVLEGPGGKIVGIECKTASDVKEQDLKGLKALQQIAGKRFHRGIVLYSGAQVFGFSKQMSVVPMSALWEWTHRNRQ